MKRRHFKKKLVNYYGYATKQERICFETIKITSNFKNATNSDLKLYNKVSSKITNDQLTLKYQKLNEKLCLYVYTDASFGNLNDRGSQGSYLIFLVGNDYNCNLLSWQSKRLK